MYDSKVTAKAVIDDVINEADIALDITASTYIRWLNELEQQLYGAVIRHTKSESVEAAGGVIPVSCNPEDIVSIYHEADELARIAPEAMPLVDNLNFYAIDGGKVVTAYGDDAFAVYSVERPVLKTEDNYHTETVKLPLEYLEIAYSKLRGEAYKLANEDGLAAKWLNDYNALLADFSVWHEQRKGYGE